MKPHQDAAEVASAAVEYAIFAKRPINVAVERDRPMGFLSLQLFRRFASLFAAIPKLVDSPVPVTDYSLAYCQSFSGLPARKNCQYRKTVSFRTFEKSTKLH